MSKHEHGTMDTSAQEQTFDGFVRWTIRISVVSIGTLIFLAVFNS
ncbi:MAG: aa3-type cytochrome c oxidase subunit IV [Rhodobacteraceae bacterium]|nr:aa3-type cytochrome c oxidase subunit IV [Paracoccaceae bacterium]